MNFIEQLLPRRSSNIEHQEYKNSSLTLVQSSILVVVITFLMGLNHFYNETFLAGFLNIGIGTACLLNLIFFKRLGDLDFSAHVNLGVCLFFIVSHIMLSNQEYSPYHLIWVACFPVYAASLLRKRATKVWTLVALVGLGGANTLRLMGVHFEVYKIEGAEIITSSLLSIGLCLFLVYRLVKNFREKESDFLRKSESILEEKNYLENAINYNIFNGIQNIKVITESIIQQSKNEQLLDFSTKILRNIDEMNQIMSNLKAEKPMDISMVDTKDIDLLSELKTLRGIFEERIKAKNILFKIVTEKHPPREGYIIKADPFTITTPILSTVLSNAINHSKHSYPVSIKIKTVDEDWIALEITDLGAGMTQTKLKEILNPISVGQIPESDDRDDFMHLSKIKAALEIIGARIYVDSRPLELYPHSHGTTVRISFPRSQKSLF